MCMSVSCNLKNTVLTMKSTPSSLWFQALSALMTTNEAWTTSPSYRILWEKHSSLSITNLIPNPNFIKHTSTIQNISIPIWKSHKIIHYRCKIKTYEWGLIHGTYCKKKLGITDFLFTILTKTKVHSYFNGTSSLRIVSLTWWSEDLLTCG